MHPKRTRRVGGGGALLSSTAAFSVVVLLLGLAPVGITAGPSPNSGHPEFAALTTAVPLVAPLTIRSFTASPSETVQGNPVFLNVTAEGGAPPYSYWYQNLPIYCLSANVSNLLCYPQYVGAFDIRVTVNDTLRDQANASTNLTLTSGIGPPPQIVSYSAWPNPAKVGALTYLAVNAESKSATPTSLLAYAFFGLPPGCASFNQTNLSCIPSEVGHYKVWVRVTDSYGTTDQIFIFLNVTGSGAATVGGSPSTGALVEYSVGVGAVVVAGVGILLYTRWRRKPPPRDTPTSPAGGLQLEGTH